jgi:hypothetical protein
MSKKSRRKKLKKKFKQLLKQKLAEQENQSLSQPKISEISPKPILVSPTVSKSKESKNEAPKASTKPQTLTNILNPYVKPDLIRIGIYLSIFVTTLIAASIINQRTTWLTSLATKVFSLLHLG